MWRKLIWSKSNKTNNNICNKNTVLYVKRQIRFGFLWYIFDLVSISNIIQMFHNMIWWYVSNRYLHAHTRVCVCMCVNNNFWLSNQDEWFLDMFVYIAICVIQTFVPFWYARMALRSLNFFLITFSIKSAISRKRCSCE